MSPKLRNMLKFFLNLCEYNALHKQNYYQTPFIAIKMANSCSFSLRENLDLIDFKLFKFCDPGGILVVSKLASNIVQIPLNSTVFSLNCCFTRAQRGRVLSNFNCLKFEKKLSSKLQIHSASCPVRFGNIISQNAERKYVCWCSIPRGGETKSFESIFFHVLKLGIVKSWEQKNKSKHLQYFKTLFGDTFTELGITFMT